MVECPGLGLYDWCIYLKSTGLRIDDNFVRHQPCTNKQREALVVVLCLRQAAMSRIGQGTRSRKLCCRCTQVGVFACRVFLKLYWFLISWALGSGLGVPGH